MSRFPMRAQDAHHVVSPDLVDRQLSDRLRILGQRHLPLLPVLVVPPRRFLGRHQIVSTLAERLCRPGRLPLRQVAEGVAPIGEDAPHLIRLPPCRGERQGTRAAVIAPEPHFAALAVPDPDEHPGPRFGARGAQPETIPVTVPALPGRLDARIGQLVTGHDA